MVKYQLRHGNDLLAWDSLRGCDVSVLICLYQSSTDRVTDRQTNKQRNKQRDGNKQTNKQANKQKTDRHTNKEAVINRQKHSKKETFQANKHRYKVEKLQQHLKYKEPYTIPLFLCLWFIVSRVCVVPSKSSHEMYHPTLNVG